MNRSLKIPVAVLVLIGVIILNQAAKISALESRLAKVEAIRLPKNPSPPESPGLFPDRTSQALARAVKEATR